ncbi:allantoinase [Fulvimarina endophytica]|uniref:Chitooligosaccharide deacetylase n=1 Tax=Fulvimarina endophytica TaxID=2293836 RepID=A0A371X9V1_9HYPH|nr:allantoinase PuuE [Fulvimarina endophytica]RFC65972.1 allantoinase [Fulvimarina endophytica]
MPAAIRLDAAERLDDLRGRGEERPGIRWPGGARLALSFVLNVEEGAERHLLDGDAMSEHLNADMRADPWPGMRNLVMESHYEYGSRVGIWRLLDLFRRRALPLTAFATGLALERVPEIATRLTRDGHEIAAHGWRWIDYRDVPEEVEASDMARCIETIERLTGTPPAGWYTGRVSTNTRRLVIANGGFLYDSDAYNDDTPYVLDHETGRHLVLPYAFDTNDMRFAAAPGFDTGSDWLDYLVDTFDMLHGEGAEQARMMSVGLHPRLAGRPGRVRALERFMDHVSAHPHVWVARRVDIARHWIGEAS